MRASIEPNISIWISIYFFSSLAIHLFCSLIFDMNFFSSIYFDWFLGKMSDSNEYAAAHFEFIECVLGVTYSICYFQCSRHFMILFFSQLRRSRVKWKKWRKKRNKLSKVSKIFYDTTTTNEAFSPLSCTFPLVIIRFVWWSDFFFHFPSRLSSQVRRNKERVFLELAANNCCTQTERNE